MGDSGEALAKAISHQSAARTSSLDLLSPFSLSNILPRNNFSVVSRVSKVELIQTVQTPVPRAASKLGSEKEVIQVLHSQVPTAITTTPCPTWWTRVGISSNCLRCQALHHWPIITWQPSRDLVTGPAPSPWLWQLATHTRRDWQHQRVDLWRQLKGRLEGSDGFSGCQSQQGGSG